MNGSATARSSPGNGRRTGKPSPSYVWIAFTRRCTRRSRAPGAAWTAGRVSGSWTVTAGMSGVSSDSCCCNYPSMRRMRDAIVIGAGHAGLAASRRLRDAGLDHLVLERGEVGESWRTQRWDSFALNTPNSMNVLPGATPDGDPDGFEGRDAWIARLERYVRDQGLQVMTRKTVTSVERDDGGFVVDVAGDAPIRTRTVIVASGMVNAPKVPPAAAELDDRIGRLTTGTYRRPDQLDPGAVLLVGSAQSGVQIAEELLDAGREVYLATGTVGRMPRRLRGRDSLYWMREVGWFDERPEDLADPALMTAAQPQISGVGARGHTVSLQ